MGTDESENDQFIIYHEIERSDITAYVKAPVPQEFSHKGMVSEKGMERVGKK